MRTTVRVTRVMAAMVLTPTTTATTTTPMSSSLPGSGMTSEVKYDTLPKILKVARPSTKLLWINLEGNSYWRAQFSNNMDI